MGGNAVLTGIIRYYSTIIDRENFGRSDFRRMLNAIKHERLVGIFPEGTTRRRVDAKAGAIHFARLSRKALLPVNIQSAGPYPPQYPFKFPRMTVSIGEPVTVAALEHDVPTVASRSERYRAMSERLMEQVDNA
jgi:1-acyl-sn-glycerol-3-phosphate acyltransferase